METVINNSDVKSKLLMISYDWMGVSMFATIMTMAALSYYRYRL